MNQSHKNSLKPGHQIHWYVIENVLGQGGFGITYLAKDINLDEYVAIKEYLPVELSVREHDESVQPVSKGHEQNYSWGLERFLEEARTLTKLRHPNIVRVRNVFESNNSAYMVMDYEHGDTLQRKIADRKTLTEDEIVTIFSSLLDGLDFIHNNKFIHRDIKPANIFIRESGEPVLLDFGSARQALIYKEKTLTKLVSPGYAPFEQYSSDGSEQGPWTDIYSLGATLYKCVTGIMPPDAVDRSKAIHSSRKDPLMSTLEICGDNYSKDLLVAIDHSLEFEISNRPQNIKSWKLLNAITKTAGNIDKLPDEEAITEAAYVHEKRNLSASLKNLTPGRMAVISGLILAVVLISFELKSHFISSYTQYRIGMMYLSNPEHSDFKKAETWLRKSAKYYLKAKEELINILLRDAQYESNIGELLTLLNSAIEQGSVIAHRTLAELYLTGVGVEENIGKAVNLFTLAAEQGDAESAYELGLINDLGLNGLVNYAAAEKWFLTAADSGHTEAQNYLGSMYKNGIFGKDNISSAITWYKKAAEQGNIEALTNLADLYYEGTGVPKDYTTAFDYYSKAAQKGAGRATTRVALMYLHGEGVNKDDVSFLKYIIQASDLDDPEALYYLGKSYDEGIGQEADKTKAAEWYRKASIKNHTKAMTRLGIMYLFGEGVTANTETAITYFLAADKDNDPEAQAHMGLIYDIGAGVPINKKQSIEWYQMAAGQDDKMALVNLGYIYSEGTGVKQDLAKAFSLYLRAATLGDPVAQTNLGESYENGRGVDVNIKEAVQWYEKAAEQGNIIAQYRLGTLYGDENSSLKNETYAYKWLTRAAENGHVEAQYKLGLKYKFGSGVEKNAIEALHWLQNSYKHGNQKAEMDLIFEE